MHLLITAKMRGFLAVIFLGLIFTVSAVSAEETAAPASGSQETLQERVARWKALREKDPEAFEQQIRERKSEIKSRLQQVKRENPQEFENFKNRFAQRGKQRMENLRQNHPEQFQQIMQKRKQRFEQWKEKNPQGYQQFLQNQPSFSEASRNRRQERTERLQPFRENQPRETITNSEKRQNFNAAHQENPQKKDAFTPPFEAARKVQNLQERRGNIRERQGNFGPQEKRMPGKNRNFENLQGLRKQDNSNQERINPSGFKVPPRRQGNSENIPQRPGQGMASRNGNNGPGLHRGPERRK